MAYYFPGVLLKVAHIFAGVSGSIFSWHVAHYFLDIRNGWASIETYKFAVHKESGRALSDIREEYMEKLATDAAEELK